MVGLLSAAGLVGFLSEPEPELQVYALRAANDGIASMWTEFAAAAGQIEALYEDESFPERQLAALVVAKIYYHLQEYDESMVFALAAADLFDIERPGEFEETITAKCIETYILLSAARNPSPQSQPPNQDTPTFAGGPPVNGSVTANPSMTHPTTPFSRSALPSKSLLSRENSVVPDGEDKATGKDNVLFGNTSLSIDTQKRLQAVIRRIFERCFHEGAYRQVVGIAVEARNLDVLHETITRASKDSTKSRANKEDLMEYILDICMNIIQERHLRDKILDLVLQLLSADVTQDYFSVSKCLVYLNKHEQASWLLRKLVDQQDRQQLVLAYQISFDLFDNGTQDFLSKLMESLPETEEKESEFTGLNGHATQPNQHEDAQESDQLLAELGDRAGAPATTTVVSRTKLTSLTPEKKKAYTSIREILTGAKSLELNLEFLYRSNKSDYNVLTKLRNSLEARNSIFHSAVTFANAFMNSGTTSDWFIRDNLEWLGKAINWSKFTVTAALGVIHRGNIGQGQKLLEPYLRESASGSSSAYSKGGALFALGLIYTNHGGQVLDYLFDQLKKAERDEVVQHGACLGLGVAGMATGAEHIVDQLKTALWSDSAISGQAAGLGMGLVLLGSGNVKALEDLNVYAHETEHDKTVRGIALGMALVMYARQEDADDMINTLLEDPDPTIRYGGIMTIAMAYCGSSSNIAVRKLLHVAVSDVNDDVRRVAVMSLGFVLFRKPGSVPRMVELLAESYNPHVRYGATMALGIACAGTGLEEAIDLLEPMMKDSTDFVRQGTFIALAMIMVQQSEAQNPKVVTIRKHFQKVTTDRHEDAMAKFGAALALGIIDAGGRNCTIGLQTQTGNLNMSAIVGMAIFTQYWYWFPLTHFLSLSFTPTSLIGVDEDLEVPQVKLHCAARPSIFEYPPSMEVKQEEAPEKVKTAVLSTTAQAKRRKIAKEKQANPNSMEIDQTPSTPKISAADEGEKMEMDEADKSKTDEGEKIDEEKDKSSGRKKGEKEKVGFEIDNMSRVLPSQLKFTSFPQGRYAPVKKPTGGVILLNDSSPAEAKTLIERQVKKASPAAGATPGNAATTNVPETPQGQRSTNTTSADAAAVLNAVDEDEDGVVEAELPSEFVYESDGEGGSD